MVFGGIDTGWTFYTPYSSTDRRQRYPHDVGVVRPGFSSISPAINFIAHTQLRAPGRAGTRCPCSPGPCSHGCLQVLATPILAITLVLLIMERVFQVASSTRSWV